MKDLKYFAIAGSFMSMLAFGVTSCIDGNDWDVDSSYDRVFSVQRDKISVSEQATSAEISWTRVKGAENYIIELSTDSLYDEIEIGQSEGAMVFGTEEPITESPYVVSGLVPDMKYFLRMKAIAGSKSDSRWSYLADYSFTTKTEQIFEPVTGKDLKAESVTLRWEVGADVERIEITHDGTLVVTHTLTAAEKEAGEATIAGLEPLTSYVATLYLGETKRGVLEFTTTAKVPDADYTHNLAAGDSLNNTLLLELMEQGYKTVNITLASGAEYYNENTLIVPDGLSVTFFGMPGDKQAIVGVKNIEIGGTHSYVNFENVELTGKNGDYVINQSNASTVETVKFNNCFIHDFKNAPFRLQSKDEKEITNLSFENCIIYGAQTRTYSLVHVDANSGSGKVENINFKNSTVVYTGKCFVYCKNTNFTSLLIENCTLSKVIGSGDYLLDCASTSYGPSGGITINNTIFGSTTTDTTKGVRSSGTVTVNNSYQTKDVYFTGNKFNGLTDYDGTETQLFKDPANNDFTIVDSSFPGKTNCGDSRWYMK